MRNIDERRGIQRVSFLQPLRGKAGDARMFVVNASLSGFRVAHQEWIGDMGDLVRLSFEYDGFMIRAQCELRWTRVHRFAGAGSKATHHSGLRITEISQESSHSLIELVEVHVVRALDEQKANAKGLPAIAAQSYQTGVAKQFVRHEFHAGTWKEAKTPEPKQPHSGFTLAADVNPAEVKMLRVAYETGAPASRTMIRDLAAASINTPDGIPTRKYMP
jgi:hypothetical protein